MLVAVLLPAGASAAAFGKRTLSFGMQGNDVTALQGDLTATGFSITVTGTFDRQTIKEVRSFQRQYGLQVDGVAGPATFKKLRKLLRKEDGNHITESATTANGASGITSDQNEDSSGGTTVANDGGAGLGAPPSSTVVTKATLIDGLAVLPSTAPATVQAVVAAANQIAFLPYVYGGGHALYTSKNGVTQLAIGYDCSGSVSFALHGGNLLQEPLDSLQFTQWGSSGPGQWMTLYSKGSYHVYMNIAGIWFDTGAQGADNGNDRWSLTRISPARGYVVRHPTGW